MRRLILLVAGVITLFVGAQAQSMTRAELEEIVAEANQDCPKVQSDGFVLQSVSLTSKDVIYQYYVDESFATIEQLASAKDALAREFLNSFSKTESMAYFLKVCKRLKVNVAITFADKYGKKCEVILPYAKFN